MILRIAARPNPESTALACLLCDLDRLPAAPAHRLLFRALSRIYSRPDSESRIDTLLRLCAALQTAQRMLVERSRAGSVDDLVPLARA